MADKLRVWLNDLVLAGTIGGWFGITLSGALGVATAIWGYLWNLPPPIIFALGLFVTACALAIMRMIVSMRSGKKISTTPENSGVRLTEVRGRTYTGETVQIDGMSFLNCTFIDCTFQWSGGPYQLVTCNLNGSRGLATTDPRLATAFELFSTLMMNAEQKKNLKLMRILDPPQGGA